LFLLDTDVVSSLRKVKKHPLAVTWIQGLSPGELSTTVINIAELQCGIERQMISGDRSYAEGTQQWLDRFLSLEGLEVYPLRLAAALILARMHETPGLKSFITPAPDQKKPRNPADLAIAAIAIAEGAIVATGNQSHFKEIHRSFPLLGLYNPFTDTWSVTPPGSSSGA
jgi:predicted nucleic acid-binding protein